MAVLLYQGTFNDAAFPSTHVILNSANYLLTGIILQVSQMNTVALGNGGTFSLQTNGAVVLANVIALSTGAGFSYPNITFPISTNLVVPRGASISCGWISLGGLTTVFYGLNIYGSTVP